MSKLSRYKKPPAIKLPRGLTKEKQIVTAPDGEDDDDFQPPRSLTHVVASGKEKARIPIPKLKVQSVTTTSSDVMNLQNCSNGRSEYFMTFKKEPDSNSSSEKAVSNRQESLTVKAVSKTEKKDKEVVHVEIKNKDEDPVTTGPPDTDNSTKAVCPFCWKQLSDKLLGTTHVKACAKNLPTDQVLNAMELQDKQIKEWENLGIAYPGFVGASTAGTGSRRGRGGASTRAPRTRKKKQDPELELAMALSASLHEEVENRKTKEREFMITNGLAHEIEMDNGQKQPNPIKETEKFQISKLVSQMSSVEPNKKSKRGKKIVLQNLPLYKVSESERIAATEQRLSQILETNFNLKRDENNVFNIREAVPIESLNLSSKLKTYINKGSSLWELSANKKTNREDFTIPAILDCKTRNKEEEDRLQALYLKTESDSQTPNGSKKGRRKLPVPQVRVQVDNTALCLGDNVSNCQGTDATSEKQKLPVSSVTSAGYLQSQQPNIKEIKDVQSRSFKRQFNERRAAVVEPKGLGLPKIVKDILKMFLQKQDTDVVVYGREEKPIKCHRLILKARCPKLLMDTVIETSSSGRKRDVISLTSFSHVAVKALIHFIYSGQMNCELTGNDLQDIQELSEKFEMELEPDLKATHLRVLSRGNDVETQTDCNDVHAHEPEHKRISKIKGNDSLSAIQTKPGVSERRSLDMFDSQPEQGVPNQLRRSGNSCDNGVGLSGDEDLFININEESFATIVARNSPHSERRGSVEVNRRQTLEGITIVEQSPIETVTHPCKDMSADGSRDLFDDVDNEFPEQYNESQGPVNAPTFDNPSENVSRARESDETTPRNVDDDGILEDEIFTQLEPHVLLSPKPHSKRSRSVSPSFNFANRSGQYTATQMADYLNLKETGLTTPDSSGSQQANKKHKLDLDVDTTVVEYVNGNANDSIILVLDTANSVSYDTGSSSSQFKQLKKDTFGTIESERSSNFSIASNSKLNSLSSPTPNYSAFYNHINQNPDLSTTPLTVSGLDRHTFQKSNVTPILPQQTVEANDPFQDDSYFAKIPSQILDIPHESSSLPRYDQIPVSNIPSFDPITTPIRSQSRAKIRKAKAGRQLKQVVEDCNINVDKGSCSNQSKKVRGKNPKISSVSQYPEPTSSKTRPHSTISTPPAIEANQHGNSTPMLNYSTIDTPILKQELKRYGLKPLPRTKAKLILRHIYKETHK